MDTISIPTKPRVNFKVYRAHDAATNELTDKIVSYHGRARRSVDQMITDLPIDDLSKHVFSMCMRYRAKHVSYSIKIVNADENGFEDSECLDGIKRRIPNMKDYPTFPSAVAKELLAAIEDIKGKNIVSIGFVFHGSRFEHLPAKNSE